jgi:predicted amidohydrolase
VFDLILRGGRVLDATANSDFPPDIAVQDGRIAVLGALGAATGGTEVDITGPIVARIHRRALAFGRPSVQR